MDNNTLDQHPEFIWSHLDFYVRRHGDELLLVETVLKQLPRQHGDQGEICTFYYELEELTLEWADAVIAQGTTLEDGKSCDFVPPDEQIIAIPIDDDKD